MNFKGRLLPNYFKHAKYINYAIFLLPVIGQFIALVRHFRFLIEIIHTFEKIIFILDQLY